MSDSVRPQRWQPTRLFCPWDSPGKNTGVGCHFILQGMIVKSESEVAQSSLTSQYHGLQPTRLLHPWDFPNENTGVGGAIAFSEGVHRSVDLSLGFQLFFPLIYMCVFVPVRYCLDDCSFVVQPVVKQVDSSSSIVLSQYSVQFSHSVMPDFCNSMNQSTPGLPVHHH